VAGQLFKHLGLQMYAGAVPAVAELISNAYDGMARNVWVTIPTDRAIQAGDEPLGTRWSSIPCVQGRPGGRFRSLRHP
jgi:hypothetical protein